MNLIATNAVGNFCKLMRRETADSNTEMCCMRQNVKISRKEGCVISGETVVPMHGARVGAVGGHIAPQAGRSRVRFMMMSFGFFIELIRRADNLHAPKVLKFLEPQFPAALRVCPGLYRDSFTFLYTGVGGTDV